MADKSSKTPQTTKPVSRSEQEAAEASTKDGLKVTRDHNQTRGEVRQQKANQGLPNKG